MLVLKRREGEWIEVTHVASGDVLRFRLYAIDGILGRANLAFDDPDIRFLIERPERGRFADSGPRPGLAPVGTGPGS